MNFHELMTNRMYWVSGRSAEFPHFTMINGTEAMIRINDFPKEPMYTLIIADSHFDFDDWPDAWVKPNVK